MKRPKPYMTEEEIRAHKCPDRHICHGDKEYLGKCHNCPWGIDRLKPKEEKDK